MKANNCSYQYPKEAQETIAKLSDPNYKKVGNYILSDDAPFEDKLKYEICQTILAYQQERKVSYEKLAQQLNLPFVKAMQILKGRIGDFSLIELESYLKKLVDCHQARIIPVKHN